MKIYLAGGTFAPEEYEIRKKLPFWNRLVSYHFHDWKNNSFLSFFKEVIDENKNK